MGLASGVVEPPLGGFNFAFDKLQREPDLAGAANTANALARRVRMTEAYIFEEISNESMC